MLTVGPCKDLAHIVSLRAPIWKDAPIFNLLCPILLSPLPSWLPRWAGGEIEMQLFFGPVFNPVVSDCWRVGKGRVLGLAMCVCVCVCVCVCGVCAVTRTGSTGLRGGSRDRLPVLPPGFFGFGTARFIKSNKYDQLCKLPLPCLHYPSNCFNHLDILAINGRNFYVLATSVIYDRLDLCLCIVWGDTKQPSDPHSSGCKVNTWIGRPHYKEMHSEIFLGGIFGVYFFGIPETYPSIS